MTPGTEKNKNKIKNIKEHKIKVVKHCMVSLKSVYSSVKFEISLIEMQFQLSLLYSP